MARFDPEEHLTKYVIDYYGGLMTRAEWLAYRAFIVEGKIAHGYSPELLSPLQTDDPDALALMRDGVESFRRQVRDRILREHADKVFFNYCPKCGGLAMTPRARQCCWCFHDWHRLDESALR
jgi:hypothetical protein